MNKSLGRLAVGLVLVLGGCSVHFHGEAKGGSKSSETSGDERASNDKPKGKDKDKRDRDKDDKKPDRDDDDDKIAKDDDKKDDDKKDDDKKDDDKKDDDKKDDDKVADNDDKKPKPRPVIDVNEGIQGAGGGTVKPGGSTKPNAGEGVSTVGGGTINPGGGGTGGAGSGDNRPEPGPAVIDVGGSNTIRLKPNKGIAQGGRGETVDPKDGDESKPTEGAGGSDDDKSGKPDKSDSKGGRAGGGFALQPGRSVPGLATVNKPIAVTGFDCKLADATAKAGTNVIVRGRGFDESTGVLVSGSAIEVRSRTATKIVAKLPKELELGGDVTLKQGNLVANCGKLEITK